MENKRGKNNSYLYSVIFKKNKKGLSAVITNLLIIMLVIVAVAIIWVVIQNVIEEGASDVSMKELNIDLTIQSVDFSSDIISVKVMNSGQGPVTGVIFIIATEEDSQRIERKVNINSKQTITFDLPYNKNMSEVEKISVAPFYETEDNEYTEGRIVDEYEVTDSDLLGITETDEGTSDDGGDDGDSQCTIGGDECGDFHSYCDSETFTCECEEDYGDCDNNWSTGCEVNLNSSVDHCGECEKECNEAECWEDPQCNDGECEYLTVMNEDDCGNDDGCCPPFCSDDPENDSFDMDCGMAECTDISDCGTNANCTEGTCSCINPWRDCDGDGNCTCNSTSSICTQDNECVYVLELNSLGLINDGVAGFELSGASDVYTSPSGNYSFITASSGDNLDIADVRDKTNPVHASNLSDGGGSAPFLDLPASVHVLGDYAYIASYNDDTLEVVDVSDPENPSHEGSISKGDGGAILEFPNSVFVLGDYAYVTSYYGDALDIINISDPANPAHVATVQDGGESSPYLDLPTSVYILGDYAYVTSENSNALQIINISDPANPNPAGFIQDGDGGALLKNPQDVYVFGGNAYVASYGSDALEILDISDPANPLHVSSFRDEDIVGTKIEGPESVYVTHYDFAEGDFAFFTTAGGILELLDVSDPANPEHRDKSVLLEGPHSMHGLGKEVYITNHADDSMEIVRAS